MPGANQYANLPPFLQAMKLMGTEAVYEAYDMDKLLKTVCRGGLQREMRQLRKLPEVPGGAGASLREEEREAPEHPEGMQEAGRDLR